MNGGSLLILLLATLYAAARARESPPRCPEPVQPVPALNTTHSGYLNVSNAPGSGALFYAYYEAAEAPADGAASLPLIVWLQGGPGCSSLFGALYELGPELVTDRLGLRPNMWAWNRCAGLLFIDQPAGTGFSRAGDGGTPLEEMAIAADLYTALQAFFLQHEELRERPVVIAGESYAGKYVPSIGLFVLQQEALLRGTTTATPAHTRHVPSHLLKSRPTLRQPPLFRLRGLVIGSGLTDPALQVLSHADTAFALGLADSNQRTAAMRMQLEIAQLIAAGLWGAAHRERERLLDFLANAAGVATLLDVRRAEAYDANATVDCYLNLPEVKVALGVPAGVRFESCSKAVGSALGPDVMQSVAYLVPDLLAAYPLLLFQGVFDLQDGPPSSSAWVDAMLWPGRQGFFTAKRRVVREADVAAGPTLGMGSSVAVDVGHPRTLQHAAGGTGGGAVAYVKSHGALTHAVLRHSGHMAPRDDPATMQWVLETWLQEVLQ